MSDKKVSSSEFARADEFLADPFQKAVVYRAFYFNGCQHVHCFSPVFGKLALNVDINKSVERGDILLIEKKDINGPRMAMPEFVYVIKENLTKQKIINDAVDEILKQFNEQERQYILSAKQRQQ